MTIENTLYLSIRKPLQLPLAQALQIDEGRLAKLSISEILSILFLLWGHTNSLGSAGETITGLREIQKAKRSCGGHRMIEIAPSARSSQLIGLV
jgi:hypothetical protein